MLEAASVGPVVFRMTIFDLLTARPSGKMTWSDVMTPPPSVVFTHSLTIRPFAWGLHQAQLLVDHRFDTPPPPLFFPFVFLLHVFAFSRPYQVPAVYPFQELDVSAIVTLDKESTEAPEAFFNIRDCSSGAILFKDHRPM